MPEKLPGWKHFYSGKIRDLYESENPSQSDLVLIVASDRISAFDNILSPAIPGKGDNLTAITNFWFENLMFQIIVWTVFLLQVKLRIGQQ